MSMFREDCEQVRPREALTVRQLAVLRRDISTFEDSYQALLKTLKPFVNHVEQPQSDPPGPPEKSSTPPENSSTPATNGSIEGGPDEPQGQSVGKEVDANVRKTSRRHSSKTRKELETLDEDMDTIEDTTSNIGIRDSTTEEQIEESSKLWQARAQQVWRESPVTANQTRWLKLDEIWSEMYRAYEDEADKHLLEFTPAPRASRLSRAPDIIRTNPMHILPSKLRLPLARPYSIGRIIWDSIGCFLLTCDAILIPITLAWDLSVWDIGGILLWHLYVSLVFWPLDFVFCLNTSYYSKDTIVESRQRILLHYCQTWLLLDLLLICLDYLSSFTTAGQSPLIIFKNLRLIRILRLARTLKLSNVGNTVAAAFNSKGSQSMILGIAMIKIIVLNVLCAAHILACVWYYIGRSNQKQGRPSWLDHASVSNSENVWREYLFSIHWVLGQVTPAPIGIQPVDQSEQLFTVFVIIFSMFVFGSSFANLRSTMDLMGKQDTERSSKRTQLSSYLRDCKVSVELAARIMRFAEFQLQKVGSVAEPPPGLVSTTLMDELLVILRKPTLVIHPIYRIIDSPVAQLGFVIKKLCSEGLVAQLYGPQHSVFVEGTLAHWSVFTKRGAYQLEKLKQKENVHFNGPCWFAEICLFTRHIHSSTLNTTSVAEAFTITRDDLISCIKSSPIVIVSFSDYARQLLALISNQVSQSRGAVPDYLPPDLSELACQGVHVQLLDGKHGKKGRSEWEKVRSEVFDAVETGTGRLNVQDLFKTIISDASIPGQMDTRIRQAFPELGHNKSLFGCLYHLDECDCVISAISSALLLTKNHYYGFVGFQDASKKLTLAQWSMFMDIVQWANVGWKALHAICVFLMLRGLVKSKRFTQMCAPTARASREEMIRHCLMDKGLYEHLPSIAHLEHEQIMLIHGICAFGDAFNLPQFLQGEIVPSSIQKLRELLQKDEIGMSSLAVSTSLQPQQAQDTGSTGLSAWTWTEVVPGPDVFRAYLFAQVCVMCGLSGHETTMGSKFMDSVRAVPVLIGVRHLQNSDRSSARDVYSTYLIERSNFVGLEVLDIENLALARLVCLSRVMKQEALEPLQNAWHELTMEDKVVLTDHFTGDGIESFAIILLFLPLYLSNAVQNTVVGTTRALRTLAEILNVLHMHGLETSDARTVEVDIQSLANYTETVHSSPAFEDAVNYIKIKKADRYILVIDDKPASLDMREQVTLIHRTVKQIARATLVK